jgi:hypothetical protein
MFAIAQLLAGFLIIHGVWALAYVAGTLLDARSPRPQTPATALTHLVARSAAGLALWGFAAFALGIAGVLNVWGLAAALVVLVVAGRVVHGPSFFSRSFWRDQLERIGLAGTGGNLALYYLALVTMIPAVYPEMTSDGVRGHLAYAQDWATHGRIYTDLLLRGAFTATNFQLVFAVFDVLHAQAFVHFAVWLCGALTVLGVRAALTMVEETYPPPSGAADGVTRAMVTFLLPATIVLSGVFLHWNDTGMIDIPIEFYVFAPVLCTVAAVIAKQDLRWAAVVTAAFAIGMKLSLPLLVPLFVPLLWVSIASLGGRRSARVGACVVMLLLASPWYVRNLVQDHDPIPPFFNAALHRQDEIFSRRDLRLGLADIAASRDPVDLALLPYRVWATPTTPFREQSNVGLFLFMYVPFAVVAGALMTGARSPRARATGMLCAAAAYTVGYCLVTSYLLRYLLAAQPPLAASVGALLLAVPRVPAAYLIRAALAVVTVVPTPGTGWWYREQWPYYTNVEGYADTNEFLTRMFGGYAQVREVVDSPYFTRRPGQRVLLVRAEVEYYFRTEGIDTIGDWFGPGRYTDLIAAMENDRLGDYVRHWNIDAVIVQNNAGALSAEQTASLRTGLERLGFRPVERSAGWYVAVR